ncbi:MAG: MoxR family ATPase [Candidatus Korobacteraceae bacterium]
MMNSLATVVRQVRGELNKVVLGQPELVTQALATVLCGGHALIEGVPGVAKTLTVKCMARVLNVGFRRVQCNSDLMPADIVGTNVFDAKLADFRVHQGPLFTELLLVDEINRMPPRTQAALLEAMEERQATIDGVSYPLPPYFTVFATQNPIEFEGTYPLPEAQLDRFLLKISVGYPDLASEVQILNVHNALDVSKAEELDLAALDSDALESARQSVIGVTVEAALTDYVARLVRKTRDWPAIRLGASPRAAIAVLRVAKAFAAMDERDFLIPDDVKAAARCTLRHRILLNPESELEGTTPDEALDQVLRSVEVPK